MRYLICDDVNKKDFWKLESLKKKFPRLKVTCFVMGKDAGDYLYNNWIEIGCHGWNHDYPPECERDDQERLIKKAMEALWPYMNGRWGFRAPGFQLIAKSYSILRGFDFDYIAHQNKIQPLKGQRFIQGKMINTHIYDDSLERVKDGEFNFIREGFSQHHSSC